MLSIINTAVNEKNSGAVRKSAQSLSEGGQKALDGFVGQKYSDFRPNPSSTDG